MNWDNACVAQFYGIYKVYTLTQRKKNGNGCLVELNFQCKAKTLMWLCNSNWFMFFFFRITSPDWGWHEHASHWSGGTWVWLGEIPSLTIASFWENVPIRILQVTFWVFHLFLGGGFIFFKCSPNLTVSYFFRWVGEPTTTQILVSMCFIYSGWQVRASKVGLLAWVGYYKALNHFNLTGSHWLQHIPYSKLT